MSIDRDDTLHPEAGGTSRRNFIKRASLAAAGLSVPGLLEACGTTGVGNATAAGLGPGGLPLARSTRLTCRMTCISTPLARLVAGSKIVGKD